MFSALTARVSPEEVFQLMPKSHSDVVKSGPLGLGPGTAIFKRAPSALAAPTLRDCSGNRPSWTILHKQARAAAAVRNTNKDSRKDDAEQANRIYQTVFPPVRVGSLFECCYLFFQVLKTNTVPYSPVWGLTSAGNLMILNILQSQQGHGQLCF